MNDSSNSDYNNLIRALELFETFSRIDYIIRTTFHGIGFVGSLLMLAVYSRAHMRKLSAAIYFRWLALFCACESAHKLSTNFVDYESIRNRSEIACRLVNYIQTLLTPMSAWFQVLVSLDRFVALVFSVRFHIFNKKLLQRVLCGLLIAYNLVFNSIVLAESNLVEFRFTVTGGSIRMCLLEQLDEISIMDFVNSSAVPFVLMSMLSLATLVGVLRARRRIELARSSPNDTRLSLGRIHKHRIVKNMRFGITVIVLNLVFFGLNFPYRLNQLFGFVPFENVLDNFVFTYLLIETSEFFYSIVFFAQIVVNNFVRQEVIRMFAPFVRLVLRK